MFPPPGRIRINPKDKLRITFLSWIIISNWVTSRRDCEKYSMLREWTEKKYMFKILSHGHVSRKPCRGHIGFVRKLDFLELPILTVRNIDKWSNSRKIWELYLNKLSSLLVSVCYKYHIYLNEDPAFIIMISNFRCFEIHTKDNMCTLAQDI